LEKEQHILKIVAIGPESTGKTTLCEQLAAHYHSIHCPEYAREYLLEHGMNYNFDDLLTIAKGQLDLEDRALLKLTQQSQKVSADHQPLPLFIDTDMYVMKVWCEVVFGKCHPFILNEIVERRYDLYLLCGVDLPWIKDELREYPDLDVRRKLYAIYLDCMVNQDLPWISISGNYEERLKKAIEAVDTLLAAKRSIN
jgi:NadR type nicotinamide-nucleotide adenylyltransferase